MSFRTVEKSVNFEVFHGQKYDKELPFKDFIALLIENYKLSGAIKKSHSLDKGYLAWQVVRNGGVPLLPNRGDIGLNTGFEGYFVGTARSEEELLAEILSIGRNIWTGIRRSHKHSYQSRLRMERSIRGEEFNLAAIQEWMAIFGAHLARQRAQIIKNPEAIKFREKTKAQVSKLPPIDYFSGQQNKLRQVYLLPDKQKASSIVYGGLNDQDSEALLTMRAIGKFGHPLLRQIMRSI